MRGIEFMLCATIAAGVFLAMYRAAWTARDDPARVTGSFRQHIVWELIWATIPMLVMLAAALPATMAIVRRH